MNCILGLLLMTVGIIIIIVGDDVIVLIACPQNNTIFTKAELVFYTNVFIFRDFALISYYPHIRIIDSNTVVVIVLATYSLPTQPQQHIPKKNSSKGRRPHQFSQKLHFTENNFILFSYFIFLFLLYCDSSVIFLLQYDNERNERKHSKSIEVIVKKITVHERAMLCVL